MKPSIMIVCKFVIVVASATGHAYALLASTWVEFVSSIKRELLADEAGFSRYGGE